MDVSGLSAKEIENLVARTIDQQNKGNRDEKEGSPSPSSNSSSSSSSSSGTGNERSGESSASGKAASSSSSSSGSGSSSTAGGDGDEKGMLKGEVVDDDEEEGGPELSRLPAEVEHLGRDAFVLHIPRNGVSTKAASAAERSSAAAGSAATTASGSAASSSPLATFEVLIPVRQFLGGSGDGGSSKSGVEAAGLRGPISEALTRVAAQLTSMRAMQASSSKITPEIMSEALQVVANRLTSGEPTTLRISATGAGFTVLDPELEQGMKAQLAARQDGGKV
ncbi:hypothetical protein DUNSADRAFT_17865 [Dunaliella salina]|nr:hypothetical protein DUNSADRAFT_17865 [Dunaliella salina]|eukprot:KAF5828271.1 hypothetical protein DUNSADRAFT_17865 [Dunaliella salina]